MHDIVIRGGTIIDGTGRPAFAGDVAVEDGRIAAVGGKAAPARRDIAADGLLVTPGWVDVHTHYDGQATWDPVLVKKIASAVSDEARAKYHEALRRNGSTDLCDPSSGFSTMTNPHTEGARWWVVVTEIGSNVSVAMYVIVAKTDESMKRRNGDSRTITAKEPRWGGPAGA